MEIVPAKHFGIRMPTWVCINKFSLIKVFVAMLDMDPCLTFRCPVCHPEGLKSLGSLNKLRKRKPSYFTEFDISVPQRHLFWYSLLQHILQGSVVMLSLLLNTAGTIHHYH